jgi:hypothetical protein
MGRHCFNALKNFPPRVFISVFLASAQQPEVRYKLRTPVNWPVWVLSPSSVSAVSSYTFANDRDERAYIEEKVRNGQYVTYRPGDMAVSHEQQNETCFITIVEGENRGSEGWVHTALMEMTPESKAYLEKKRAEEERAEADRRAAAERAAAKKKRAAEDDKRKELAYRNSLPKLVSQGETVIIATSMDCAKDLQSVVGFGKKNGTGVEFRKKMLELVTLGCAQAMENGTPLVKAAKNGQFVTFTTYGSGKNGVALDENVRWP